MDANVALEGSSTSATTKQGTKRKVGSKNINFNLNGISLTQATLSDHTPTPTRFIRNCEEVGLFQDLQNVNPFEEGFQKALNNLTGDKLPSVCNNDDMLHTPKILPHIVYPLAKNADKQTENNISDSNSSFSDDLNTFELNVGSTLAAKSNGSRTSHLLENAMRKVLLAEQPLGMLEQKERKRQSNRKAARRAYQKRIREDLKNKEIIKELREENQKLKEKHLLQLKEIKNLHKQLRIVSSKINMGEFVRGQCEKSFNMSTNSDIENNHNNLSKIDVNFLNISKPRVILPKLSFTPVSSAISHAQLYCISTSNGIVQSAGITERQS